MQKILRGMKGKSGFTLIELMIVVAIIGILAAIAIPNFLKFQAKAKQSESKTNLAAVHTAEVAYFGEFNEWGSAFGLINWEPEGQNRYAYVVGDSGDLINSGPNLNHIPGATTVPSPLGVWMVCDAPVGKGQNTAGPIEGSGDEARGFTAMTTANVDSDDATDGWSVNDDKVLRVDCNDV